MLEKPSALQEIETRKATHRAGSEDWRSHPPFRSCAQRSKRAICGPRALLQTIEQLACNSWRLTSWEGHPPIEEDSVTGRSEKVKEP